VTKFSNISVDL